MPFLDDFYEEVLDNLGDPKDSARVTKAKMYRDLHRTDVEIFEDLLALTGPESLVGFSEIEIPIVKDQVYYTLPPGFRQHIAYEKRTSENTVTAKFPSRPPFGTTWGIEILSQEHGFRLFPPSTDDDNGWWMRYLRSPPKTHYARTTDINLKSMLIGSPGENAGEVFHQDDYYVGAAVQLYAADNGVPVTRICSAYKNKRLFFRTPLVTVPQGTVMYEIRPALPHPYDAIYALDVSTLNMHRRDKPAKAAFFESKRKRLWDACSQYAANNVMDRGPERLRPLKPMDFMPSGESPFFSPQ